MKLIDALRNVDRSEENTNFTNLDAICLELGLTYVDNIWSEFGKRIKSHWVQPWLCTDTYVGLAAIYMDDEPVAYSWQDARKSDENIFFLSKEAAKKVRDFIVDLDNKNEHSKTRIVEDPNEEIGESYTVTYASQLVDNEVLWEGKRVKVVHRHGLRYENPSEDWNKIDVQTPDGIVHKKVPLDSITIPYRVKPSTRL